LEIKAKLREIIGVEYVFDEPQIMERYSKDYSLDPPRMPNYVVQPKDVTQVQDVIKLANEHRMPVIPCSSGVHFNGATLPSQGGIVLDLRGMNKILEVDERNRKARIEPGVTWGQLQAELEGHELMGLLPLLPHPLKSALTSHLEREPMLIPKYEYGDPLLTMEVVLPTGELFRTGSACVPGYTVDAIADGVQPEGPGIGFWRLFQGAQGTMGVVTWANVKVEYLPQVNKTFFIPCQRVEDAIEPIYRMQRRMIGQECLLLNNFNLAAILAQSPADLTTLSEALPPWSIILILAGGRRHPEEKIEYEEEALMEIGSELPRSSIMSSLPAVPGVERRLPRMLRQPWPEGRTYWKFCHKGSCQDISFHTTWDKAPQFITAIGGAASKYGYPVAEVGFYLQPVERARACRLECDFYYNPDDLREVDRVRKLYADVAEILLNMGAFFTTPYGIIAELVYGRATEYAIALTKIKGLLDPNNIMSPGKLCF
jgi:FAD/FMN-containing dehydrogenase